MFVEAYKDAGGKINECDDDEYTDRIICKYSGKSKACQYILLGFFRVLFNCGGYLNANYFGKK